MPFLPYVDTCVKEYYEKLGDERDVYSAKGPCLLVIRSQQDRWLRLRLNSTIISPGIFVFIELKDSTGNAITNWTLDSKIPNSVRNFDSLERGSRFEINHTTNVPFAFTFKSYSAC